MNYTVQKLARLAGVSVRTLHYYDEIGLLKPSLVKENGYRYYAQNEIIRLQQILFFRELEFPLHTIKKIMDNPSLNTLQILLDQQTLLLSKKARLEKVLATIEKSIQSMKGGEHMSTDDTFSAFNDPTYQLHKDEAEKRWGNTDAYKQSMERVGKLSQADLERVKAEAEDITTKTVELMKQGYGHDSQEVQEQIERFYQHLRTFYEPSFEMFKGLGQMYVDDPRFTVVYEKRADGFAAFMRDAMAFYADIRMK